MSLATRCPACHTVFRVVQDQLRVSEGWVRCGQCQEVFNALETLFDLDVSPAPAAPPAGSAPVRPPAVPTPPTQTPPAPAPSARPPASSPVTPATEASAAEPHAWSDDDDALAEALARELAASPADNWAPPDPGPLTPHPATHAADRDAASAAPAPVADTASPGPTDTDAAMAAAAAFAAPVAGSLSRAASPSDEAPPRAVLTRQSADAPADEREPTPSRFMGPMPSWADETTALRRARTKGQKRRSEAPVAQEPPAGPPPGPDADPSPDSHPQAIGRRARRARTPAFVRQAEREAAWQRPLVRAALGGVALLLSATLAAQAVYHYRDVIAARQPGWAPALAAACQWLGCQLRAPLALDPLRLEASDLVRTDREQVLRLTADLHNTATHAVRRPALDVAFTDASGRLLARRVFPAQELGAAQEAIDAGGTWRIDALIAVGTLPVTGYTVEVFYP